MQEETMYELWDVDANTCIAYSTKKGMYALARVIVNDPDQRGFDSFKVYPIKKYTRDPYDSIYLIDFYDEYEPDDDDE